MMENRKRNKYRNPVTATLTGIREIFRRQKPDCLLNPDDRLDGKTVLIDGASSGLGFAVAVEVARRGARIIMACRSGIPEKGEEVKKLSGNPNVQMLPIDFSDINSIWQLVSAIQDMLGYEKIDILICNAAVVPRESRRTPQELEEMFMVNYLSKFIFINMLIEKGCVHSRGHKITESQSHISHQPHQSHHYPRIIIISSESHRNPEEFYWEGFGKYKEYGMNKTLELYGYYKLLLTTFARELSQKLNPDGETNYSVFSLCPGPINSRIAREAPFLFQPLLKLVFYLFFKSPEKAAIPVVYLASSKEIEGKPFDYLFLMSRKEIAPLAADLENRQKLWEISENLRKTLSNKE
jgi:NAD(P)-dependent dehydrogenase (short-subunit alcohol dehydrogenase family)